MAVRVDLNISLDGVAMPADPSPENPMGADWGRLVEDYTATRTFRERIFGDTSGAGTTGVDDRYGAAYFEGVGAEVMGAGMFGLHAFADDPEWRGWWGDAPPFRVPVFVLTHRRRAPIAFDNGTRFEFVSATVTDTVHRAAAVAGGADVRIGGGVGVVRAALEADLVDRLHVAVRPIVLGRGTRLWDDLRDLDRRYSVTSEVAESGVVHVTFTR
ncbi:dihydrofolate reductase family protein [Microbacterium trichothecenolyticum]|uniref:Dihydrofolate reductase n=1 Tax=Microbacterium trichothecenolyticum TaxID=69370 RepID=A0ABU0TYK0_MICTR|nr:dihydrofolate reductase family protein [Microbacterium trichothecenolyticum]MDQ1124590.1 dihydrofolate reductase [Microbacterium trichothecenolyticum]